MPLKSLNHKSLPMSLSLSVSLSKSERSHVSTTALQCFEIRRWLTESLSDNVTYWAVLESWKQVTSVFSGLVVFSILGFMAHTNGLTVQVSLIFFLFVLLLHFWSGTYFVVHKHYCTYYCNCMNIVPREWWKQVDLDLRLLFIQRLSRCYPRHRLVCNAGRCPLNSCV